jgi:hypothetical protein
VEVVLEAVAAEVVSVVVVLEDSAVADSVAVVPAVAGKLIN